jgi:hypothetical protein
MTLLAQWALFTKEPGDTEDYRVLEASRGRLTPRAYEQLIRRHLPGTPEREAGDRRRPDALPWVWFSPTSDEDGATLGVAILEMGTSKDFTGRRADRTRYFRLGWSEIESAGPSYSGLARALHPVYLPAADGEPVVVSVEPMDRRELVDRIERLSFERIAVVAALLLDGPVALLHAGGLPVDERLACLDAIAALLPYGFRADLTASTWAGPTAQLRLSFSARARTGQSPVDWDEPWPLPDPGHGLVAEYLDLLRDLTGRHGIRRVVELLATDTQPLSFQEPERAVERLRTLDPPYIAWRDVHVGRGDRTAVRAILSAEEIEGLEVRQVDELATFLLLEGDERDLPTVERHWTSAQVQPLCAAVANLLGGPDGTSFARPYLDLARRREALDALLTDLLLGQGQFDQGQAPSPALRAQRLEVVQPYLVRATPGDLPGVRQVLVEQPDLVYDLLASRPSDLVGLAQVIAEWLADGHSPPRGFRPLHAVLDRGPFEEDDVTALWHLGPRHVRTLLRVASHTGMVVAVLSTVWRLLPQLAETDELSSEERQGWRRTLEELATADIGAATRLQLDLLGLLVDGRSLRTPDLMVMDDDREARAFHAVYWGAELDRVRPPLADRLIREVARWAQSNALTDSVLLLLRSVADREPPPGTRAPRAKDLQLPAELLDITLGFILDSKRDPGLLELPQYQDWWRLVLGRSPGQVEQASDAEQPAPVQEAVSLETAVTFAARELLANPEGQQTMEAVLGALRDRFLVDSPERFEVFLSLLRAALRRGNMPPDRVDDLDLRIVEAVHAGAVSDWLAKAYPRHLGRMAAEFDHVGRLLDTFWLQLTPEERTALNRAASELERRTRSEGGPTHRRLWQMRRPGR